MLQKILSNFGIHTRFPAKLQTLNYLSMLARIAQIFAICKKKAVIVHAPKHIVIYYPACTSCMDILQLASVFDSYS